MATFKGKGIVWDSDKGKRLCNLNKGSFTTEDEREQSIMRKAGFIGDYEDEYPIIEEDDGEEAIRTVAKGLGIAHYWNKNIENLRQEIEEMEDN